ncbi:hypothetical protein T265_10104, partial [Opisthorchis viverrini]
WHCSQRWKVSVKRNVLAFVTLGLASRKSHSTSFSRVECVHLPLFVGMTVRIMPLNCLELTDTQHMKLTTRPSVI